MNILSLFRPKPKQQAAVIEISNTFSSFSGSAFNSPVFRAAVDCVAKHAAKLNAHSDNKRLETLLTSNPNPYMSSFDMIYKLSAAYFTNNNAFVLIERNDGEITALYPLTPSNIEFQQGQGGTLNINMRFADGRDAVFPYNNIIHLRRFYFNHELSGADNRPLYSLLETADVLEQGTRQGVKNAVALRGYLKFTSLVNPQQVKLEKEQFVKDYLNPSNVGGIGAVDQRFDFVPTNSQAYNIPESTINAVQRQIYDYLGVSQKIVSGCYSEDEFSAFYEAAVEPLALQLSQEFSRKTGIDVVFTSERLEFSSAATKIKLLHEAAPLGVLTINECRKLLALPPVEDGGKRLQSLNYINAAGADEYQEITESEESINGNA